jgi:hypothetical protein
LFSGLFSVEHADPEPAEEWGFRLKPPAPAAAPDHRALPEDLAEVFKQPAWE